MQTNLSLLFLHEKINKLKTALFFDASSSVLKFPSSVINVMCVDDIGQVWFCMPSPVQSIDVFEKVFFCQLHFFSKGNNFYLNTTGIAHIVNDPEEVNSIECVDSDCKEQVFLKTQVLVKVQIENADYREYAKQTKREAKKMNNRHLTGSLFLFGQFLRRHLLTEQHHEQTV
jgi:hypothetical protein